jgi:hypothetical protein
VREADIGHFRGFDLERGELWKGSEVPGEVGDFVASSRDRTDRLFAIIPR